MLILNRLGDPSFNSSVFITDGSSRSWLVDPNRELLEATGYLFARRRGIASFAVGLRAAGHYPVTVRPPVADNNWSNTPNEYPRQVLLRYKSDQVPVYFLVGLAWGQGDWDRLKASFQKIAPQDRKGALVRMAQRYHWAYLCTSERPRLVIA